MNSSIGNRTRSVSTSVIAAVLAATPLAATAQQAPLAHLADPSVYKVLSENDLFRVLLATSKPGQRDALHSHPPSANYVLTPCNLHTYLAKDSSNPMSFTLSEGSAWTQNAEHGHSHENVGKSDCQVLIVERK